MDDCKNQRDGPSGEDQTEGLEDFVYRIGKSSQRRGRCPNRLSCAAYAPAPDGTNRRYVHPCTRLCMPKLHVRFPSMEAQHSASSRRGPVQRRANYGAPPVLLAGGYVSRRSTT